MVDGAGRLVGMITVDDIVHIIQEEAGEDVLLLSGAGDEGDINEPVGESYRARVRWLIANLLTALVAAIVIRQFEDIDRAAGDPRRADADRRRGRRQCRDPDAGGDGARDRHQPADRIQPLARGLARNPRRPAQRR